MLFLFTGGPGASKTLSAIKFVNEDDLFAVHDDKGKPTAARRPVFYFNMREVKLPWTELSLEEAMKWFELPAGSVIVFDEAYDIFPQRLKGEAPLQVKKLATHRHNGYDIVLITQRVTGQLDAFVRGLVGRHIHLERRFGTALVTRLEWQKCCEHVNDYHARKEAISSNQKIDKKYFGSYYSAEVHTVQSNLPWKRLIGLGFLVVFIVGMFFLAYSVLTRNSDASDFESTASYSDPAPLLEPEVRHNSPHHVSVSEYAALYTPRVAGLPHTAPAYDELTQPKTYPKPSCMLWAQHTPRAECKCLSQQGTTIAMSFELCQQIAVNGLFDPAKEDRDDVGRNRESKRPGNGSGDSESAGKYLDLYPVDVHPLDKRYDVVRKSGYVPETIGYR